MSCCAQPLDFGTVHIGDQWEGFRWGIIDPVTLLPVDLTGARVVSHWRKAPNHRTPNPSPDTPDLSFDSEDTTATISDGDEPLGDLSFEEFMSARLLSTDPFPSAGYPWIVSLEPVIIDPDTTPGNYEWDAVLVLNDNPITIRSGTVTLRNRVTRFEL